MTDKTNDMKITGLTESIACYDCPFYNIWLLKQSIDVVGRDRIQDGPIAQLYAFQFQEDYRL